ncbi:MAG: hypothetical protein NVV82_12165 [Sporocytophaga sp.]|nr:hypothetical protein [Sporocytophaga sp.]
MIDIIKFYKDKKKYFKVQRQVAKDVLEKSHGYVVDFSKSFVLLQDTDDFQLDGYSIFPVSSIAEIQNSATDKHYDKIMHLEGLTDEVCHKHKIDLTSWISIFKSLRALKLNVIIENEDPSDTTFDIGPITKVTKTAVYVRYFDSKGYLDNESTKIPFDLFTIVRFDERYVNTMSKYLRERKSKNKK